MTTVIQQPEQAVRIPAWVCDLSSFRRWARSDEFPDQGWYAHLAGDLWVDPSMERVGHNLVKGEIGRVLANLTKRQALGKYFGDRMLLTNVEAELSTEPDGMFVAYETLKSGRVRLAEGVDSTEVEGSPDLVLEVISPNSRHKDTTVLRSLYWRARVKEYWLAEPRRDDVFFQILRTGPRGYSAVRSVDGWLKSTLLGSSFRLICETDPLGDPAYTLEMR